jgi:hypothetical protein
VQESSLFIAGFGPDGVHSPSNAAASAAAADLWRQHYDAAKQFKADFKQNPRATANKCRCEATSLAAAKSCLPLAGLLCYMF